MQGKITISRTFSNQDNPRPIRIELEDDISSIHFLEVEMTLESFAEAITGHGYIECEFKLRGVDRVGMKLETKTEIVPVPDGWNYLEGDCFALLSPFEVDGWSGHKRDLGNWHNHMNLKDGRNAFRVNFSRHVAPDEPGA